MMSPILDFLIGIEMSDLAMLLALLVHRTDHLLHEIDLDILHALTSVMWSVTLVVQNRQQG